MLCCLTVHGVQGMFFGALSAHDEDRLGRNVPYPAAGALGQLPCAATTAPPDDDTKILHGAHAVDQPAEGTSTAAAAGPMPQGDCSLADLCIGPCLARQTYLARSALPHSNECSPAATDCIFWPLLKCGVRPATGSSI